MKKNYVFNDTKKSTQIPFIIYDQIEGISNNITRGDSSYVFENCTVHFSKIKKIEESAEGMIVTINAENVTVSFNEAQTERIINSFLNKYGISKEKVHKLISLTSLSQEGKINLLVEETEIPKITEPLSMYTIDVNSSSVSCGYRYEFEYLDVYPSTVEQFERAKSMDIED